MDEDKLETVKKWTRERRAKNCRRNDLFQVQHFLGFCNHYRQFIPHYSETAAPLTTLTMKDELFGWEVEQQLAFEMMIGAVTTASVL